MSRSPHVLRGPIAIALAALLVLTGCSSSPDGSQIAAGGDNPLATTPPLAVPPSDLGVTPTGPTTAPATAPTEPTAIVLPTATEATPTPVPATAVPATAVPATAVPATAVPAAAPATAVPAAAATAVPADTGSATAVPAQADATSASDPAATAATAVPAPAASGGGIALGDFEVVNLLTGANQNIAELSPAGPTMLWFWAPH